MSDKFSEFKDTDGTVIYDVDEERALREKLMEEGILEVEEKRREIRSVEGIEESGTTIVYPTTQPTKDRRNLGIPRLYTRKVTFPTDFE